MKTNKTVSINQVREIVKGMKVRPINWRGIKPGFFGWSRKKAEKLMERFIKRKLQRKSLIKYLNLMDNPTNTPDTA